MKCILFAVFTLLTLFSYSQSNYLNKTSIEVRKLASEYNVESIRVDDGSKCLFYKDETDLLFAMYFDENDMCKLVIVTPQTKLMELTLFKFLDDNWTPISSTQWSGNSKSGRVSVKAIKDDKLEIYSFYYSL